MYHLTITELFKNVLSTEEFMGRVDARKALTLVQVGEDMQRSAIGFRQQHITFLSQGCTPYKERLSVS